MEDKSAAINKEVQEQIDRIAANCAGINPLVVINCITYNHEPFIREALDGFVMQKANFSFVAVVHDDASTDGTAAIIREYAEKYPDIILPIYETENQHSKHDGSLGGIMQEALNATGAKYVAMCEGDDYWTDPLKLQKQVDFLESHPDYSMCFHNAVVHWEDDSIHDHLFADLEKRDYDFRELGAGWNVPTASALLSRNVMESKLYKKATSCRSFIYGDVLLWLSAVEFGKIYCSGETMSVYRRHAGSVTLTNSPNRVKQIITHCQTLPIVFGDKYKFSAIDSTVNLSLGMCLKVLKNHDYKVFMDYFLISFRYAPLQTCKKIITMCFDKLKRH